MVGTVRRRAQPQVPVEFRRHGRGFGRTVLSAEPCRELHLDLAHGSDHAALDQFHYPPVVVARVDLRAELGGEFVLALNR